MSIKPFILPFTFHDNFASLTTGDDVTSALVQSVIDDYGNHWTLVVFLDDTPGDDGEPPTDPMVDVRLDNGDEEIRADGVVVDAYFAFILRDARGRVYAEPDWDEPATILPGEESNAWPTVRQSEMLNQRNNILRDGHVFIDVHIQLKKPPEEEYFKALPSLSSKMIQLLEDEEDKDVSFQVGGEILSAHTMILKKDPSILFSICEDNDDGSHIIINDTTPEIFRMILRYIYGEAVPSILDQCKHGDPSTNLVKKCKEVIDAANRFGVVGLKLAAEEALVDGMVISAKNVADWLIFSDAKTCPLLKEQATAFFVSRSEDMLNSDASNQLRESPRLLGELMMEISRAANHRRDFEDESDLSVTELRKRLMKKGLDVDGDKEMLVARLRGTNGEQQMDETE